VGKLLTRNVIDNIGQSLDISLFQLETGRCSGLEFLATFMFGLPLSWRESPNSITTGRRAPTSGRAVRREQRFSSIAFLTEFGEVTLPRHRGGYYAVRQAFGTASVQNPIMKRAGNC
jgi:hypothetical protein